MSSLIRSIHNTSSTASINLGIAGFDPTESLLVAPSTTVDLLSIMTADSLHAMQAQLASLVTAGEATIAATIDSSVLYNTPYTAAQLVATPQIVARYQNLAVATDIGTPIVLFTPTVSGLYQINAYQVCTASATGTDSSGQTLVGWTDVTGFNQWYFQATTLNNATLIVAGTKAVYATAGTPIQFYTNGLTGPWATLRENYYFTIVQL